MKHFRSLKNWALLGVVALFAASCSKNTNNEPLPPIANLAVYHVSPDAPKLGFRLNNSILNTDSVPYGTYGYYFNAVAGSRELAAYQQGTKKASSTLNLKEAAIYSAWLTGKWATPEFVVIEDKLVNPSSGKALIRFVNMSVDAPALDLVTNTGTSIVSGEPDKTASEFVEITGGQNYNFVIRETSSNTDKAVIPSVTITSGRIYTIAARGIYTATGDTGIKGDVLINY